MHWCFEHPSGSVLVGPQGCGAASLQVWCAALGDSSGAIPDLSHAILEAPEGTVDRATLHLRRAECIAQVAHHTIARRVERTEQLTIDYCACMHWNDV